MITGDQAAIAKETCRMLGLGTNVRTHTRTRVHCFPLGPERVWVCPCAFVCVFQILTTAVLNGQFQHLGATLNDVILHANGFAEVYPEHKFQSTPAPYPVCLGVCVSLPLIVPPPCVPVCVCSCGRVAWYGVCGGHDGRRCERRARVEAC